MPLYINGQLVSGAAGTGEGSSPGSISTTTPQSSETTTSNPTDLKVSPTGVTAGPLADGTWKIKSAINCYWLTGGSGLAVGDVDVDEGTPDVSHQIFGGDEIYITVDDATNAYIAFKSVAGGQTGIVTLTKQP